MHLSFCLFIYSFIGSFSHLFEYNHSWLIALWSSFFFYYPLIFAFLKKKLFPYFFLWILNNFINLFYFFPSFRPFIFFSLHFEHVLNHNSPLAPNSLISFALSSIIANGDALWGIESKTTPSFIFPPISLPQFSSLWRREFDSKHPPCFDLWRSRKFVSRERLRGLPIRERAGRFVTSSWTRFNCI